MQQLQEIGPYQRWMQKTEKKWEDERNDRQSSEKSIPNTPLVAKPINRRTLLERRRGTHLKLKNLKLNDTTNIVTYTSQIRREYQTNYFQFEKPKQTWFATIPNKWKTMRRTEQYIWPSK